MKRLLIFLLLFLPLITEAQDTTSVDCDQLRQTVYEASQRAGEYNLAGILTDNVGDGLEVEGFGGSGGDIVMAYLLSYENEPGGMAVVKYRDSAMVYGSFLPHGGVQQVAREDFFRYANSTDRDQLGPLLRQKKYSFYFWLMVENGCYGQ